MLNEDNKLNFKSEFNKKYNNLLEQYVELSDLFLNTDVGAIYIDHNYQIKMINPVITDITGINYEDIGKKIDEITYFRRNLEFLGLIYQTGSTLKPNEFEILDSLGKYWLIRIRPRLLNQHNTNGINLTFFNITQRKTMEQELELERVKYRIIADLTDCGIWDYDIKTHTLHQKKKLKGRYSEDNLIIPNYRNTVIEWGLIHPEDIEIFHKYCDSMDRGDEYIEYELRTMGDNDEYIWTRFQGSTIKDKNGNFLAVVGKTINIDDEKKDKDEFIHKQKRDNLTGVYKSAVTKDKIIKFLDRYENYETPTDNHAFIIIDIDDFKMINDSYGHLYGNLILERLGEYFREEYKGSNIIGRTGGDEFVAFMKGIKSYDQIANEAEKLLNFVNTRLSKSDNKKDISLSIGISIFPKDGACYEELYKNADIALYNAKRGGKNRYYFYDEKYARNIDHGETERKRIIKNVKEDAHIESNYIDVRLLNFVFDVMNKTKVPKVAIHDIFSEIGKYYELSRIHIFEKDLKSDQGKISFQWVNKEASCDGTSMEHIFNHHLDEILAHMPKGKDTFIVEDVSKYASISNIMKEHNKTDMQSFLLCPLYDVDQFIGIVTFEDCSNERYWSQEQVDTLSSITKFINNYIIQLRSKELLDNEVFFTKATLQNQMLSNYAVDPKTYEILYISDYNGLFPSEVKVGDICYKSIMNLDAPCPECPLKGLSKIKKKNAVETYNNKYNTWNSNTASVVYMPNGRKINLLCISDITSFIERVKSRDILTGLLTYSRFEVEAIRIIGKNIKTKYAVLYTDFDKFKFINDEYGYSIGDHMLRDFAILIDKNLGKDELCCRVNADNFAILLKYDTKDEVIQRIQAFMQEGHELLRQTYRKIEPITIIGVYFMSEDDKDFGAAVDKANLARKSMKGYHKSNYAIYDEQLHSIQAKEIEIENKMHSALLKNEFVVYVQPKVDLISRKICGGEALVRWQEKDGSIISPKDFIPIFEKNGFIIDLDFYVYDKILKRMSEWLYKLDEKLVISMNVSRMHINQSDFIERFDALVEKYKIPKNQVELEITESMFLDNIDRLKNLMKELKERGYLISIDDFGSGYSSLNMLKTLPVDIIKLDKDFFLRNEMKHKDQIVISSIINIAKGLGLKVISEGVETNEQEKFLAKCGCDMVQGYLFYKPMPVKEFEDVIFH